MAYNNYFPAGYQPMYNAYQQPNPMNQQSIQQTMTPPTIHADIVQVENETAANNYPVGAGESQMMIARDDSAIFIKTAMQNGQSTLDVYVKRPPEPDKPKFDPTDYVRKDELQELIAAQLPKKTKKEGADA